MLVLILYRKNSKKGFIPFFIQQNKDLGFD